MENDADYRIFQRHESALLYRYVDENAGGGL